MTRGDRQLENKGFLVACGDRDGLIGDLTVGDRGWPAVTCGDRRPDKSHYGITYFPRGFMGVHGRLRLGPPAVTGNEIEDKVYRATAGHLGSPQAMKDQIYGDLG